MSIGPSGGDPEPTQPYGGSQPPPPTGPPAPSPPFGAPTQAVAFPSGPYGAYSAYGASPQAPYGVDPRTGVPYSDKQKLVAGLLQIFLGGFGIGRFYIGDTTTGVLQIVVTVLTCGLGSLWGLIDGIVMLTKDDARDAKGFVLRPN